MQDGLNKEMQKKTQKKDEYKVIVSYSKNGESFKNIVESIILRKMIELEEYEKTN